MTEKHFVVVDGSNLATEGRKTPSLAQLDEAVRAYTAENPDAEMVVVVDASFEHRIDPKEAAQLEQAELHGELVSPPAGAIGRGDAFVLRIAERTGATVLSNDSFQEFHDQHRWLFDAGRLVGGKPVKGVGWIFTPRTPVRGAKSHHADRKGKRQAAQEMAPEEKAAELAKAAKRAAERGVVRNGDGSMPRVGDVWVAGGAGGAGAGATETKDARGKAADKKGKKKDAKKEAAVEPALAEAPVAKAPKRAKATKATKTTKATKATKAAADKAPRATEAAPAPARAAAATTKKAASKKAATKKAPAKAAAEKAPAKAPAGKKAAKPAKATKGTTTNRRVRAAIVDATAEALEPEAPVAEAAVAGTRAAAEAPKRKRRRAAPPPPAVNEPMAFISFVAAYPMGSKVTGEVASFTSHGAMIEVPVPEGGSVYCYVPLAGLGVPPPVKARDVLARGERRTFALVGLDPARRVAELALPEVAKPPKTVAKRKVKPTPKSKAESKAESKPKAKAAAGR